jgi:hypothetical protein
MRDPAQHLLGFVWAAYDNMCSNPPVINTQSLERSISQLLETRIDNAMTGFEPFRITHEAFEFETMASPPAQPPAYDLAFVFKTGDERIMWPLEAKVLDTPKALAEYERDVREQFLTCRYAPFSSSGAMLAYLLTGSATDTLNGIATKLGCNLEAVKEFPSRPHRVSSHLRNVPAGKTYPADFRCHHLVLEYHGLTRHPT